MTVQQDLKSGYFYGLKPEESVAKSHATRTAETCCQYMLPTLQRMAKEKPDLKLLDVGCGPGSITLSLAKYIPKGTLIGIDLSETVLEKARQHAKEQNVPNTTFQTADVYALPFPDETFDIVHTHQAVAHFHEHIRAIQELVRVTKKGGVLCMREGDLYTASFYPEYPLLSEMWKALITVHESGGGTADAGRKLKAWTVRAGIARENVVFTAGSWCYDTVRGRREFDGGRIFRGPPGDLAVKLGVVTRERIQEYEEAWRQWTEDEDGLYMMMHGEVIALK